MAALPYMQLYVAEYLADTAHLRAIEHGAYLLLLMNYWQRGKPLMDSNERLATVARMSNEEWICHRSIIAEFFEIRDGLWVHKRVERDLLKVNGVSESARKAGIASAKARNKGTLNGRSTEVEQMQERTLNHTDTDTEQRSTKELPPAEDRQLRTAKAPSPESIAVRVQERTGVVTSSALKVFTAVCRREQNSGIPPDSIVDAMGEAWLAYQKAVPELSITFGAEKFFGEGHWKDRRAWAWKHGPPKPNGSLEVPNKALLEIKERERKVKEERGGTIQ